VRRRRWLLWTSLLLIGVGVLSILIAWQSTQRPLAEEPPTSTPASPTVDPVIPTRTPTREAMPTATLMPPTPTPTPTPLPATVDPTPTPRPLPPTVQPTPTPTPTSVPSPIPTPTATETPQATPTSAEGSTAFWQGQPRWGVAVSTGPISRYETEPLHPGWYLDWRTQSAPPRPGGANYAQMIRLMGGRLGPDAETIAAVAQANAGSLWLVGNEPDVKWQDNIEPTTYARLYHEARTAIKTADPKAQVAIGGVAQPTPLRLQYLDAVLAAYQDQFGAEMPVDVWNVHAFILREERGSWGVDIPPGLPDAHGKLYEIDDGDNMEIFRQQITDFRRWMAQRGYRDRPLIVSEYGILMPADYGFPPERVAAFLAATFDFFLTATDPALGYPADGNRLVQLWCWYALDASASRYPTGNLFDPQTGERTAVGEGWMTYVQEH
jgi:hypothetical protein